MEEHILICEDSLEGIFTGIYFAYERHYPPGATRLETRRETDRRLFAVYEEVAPDRDRTEKVARSLQRKFGGRGYLRICQAAAAADGEKATAIYRTVALGLKSGQPWKVWERQADDCVRRVWDLSLRVWRELDHLCGFLRFRELENGILYAEAEPRNDLLVFLADHFADRFPQERFVIRDAGRNCCAAHERGKACIFIQDAELSGAELAEHEKEREYQELFRLFHRTIAIKERKNENLQRNMLPLRFRPYMTEWRK